MAATTSVRRDTYKNSDLTIEFFGAMCCSLLAVVFVLVLSVLKTVRAPTASDDQVPHIITAPVLLLPPLESPGISTLPNRAQGFVTVPHAHSLLVKFDFSLPAVYRLGIARYSPEEVAGILQDMYHYHRQIPDDEQVPRPMEFDYPRIIDLQTEEEERGPIQERAFEALERMRQNAWLLTGKQVMMLNNVQHRIRSLTTQQLVTANEDPIEAKVLRSRLDSALRDAHSNPDNIKMFPELLREALEQTRAEQLEYLAYRGSSENRGALWNACFPFLANNGVDMAHFLLRY